ncbi:MAG: hypothetical protein MHM6MM_001976 [Cercozoa sp. M6MM]
MPPKRARSRKSPSMSPLPAPLNTAVDSEESSGAVAPLKTAPAKRSATTGQPAKRRRVSEQKSDSAARLSPQEKFKKNLREKKRRGDINELFDELCRHLALPVRSKTEKVTILAGAINLIERLTAEIEELKQIDDNLQEKQEMRIELQKLADAVQTVLTGAMPFPSPSSTGGAANLGSLSNSLTGGSLSAVGMPGLLPSISASDATFVSAAAGLGGNVPGVPPLIQQPSSMTSPSSAANLMSPIKEKADGGDSADVVCFASYPVRIRKQYTLHGRPAWAAQADR